MMEKIMMWRNVLKRINYFSDMYPMSTILKEAIFFPLDYLRPDTDITTVRNVTLSITHRCNIKCSMCFYHLNLHDAKEMNLETFKKIIQQVHKTKPGIILTGGEPFMHKNLVEFVKYAKSFNLPVQIFTNGTLMKPEVLHQLFDAKLDYLNITVLGNKEVHDTVAQVKGSYDRLVKNLEYASQIKASTKIILNYSITPESVETLDEPIKLANQYNCEGVRYQHYNFLTTKELASQKAIMNKEMGTDDSQTNDVEQNNNINKMGGKLKTFINELNKKNEKLPIQWAPTLSNAEIDTWYVNSGFKSNRKCLFPWRGLQVEYDGSFNPCSKIYHNLGNVNDKGVFEVWNTKNMKLFRQKLKKKPFPACSRCCKL